MLPDRCLGASLKVERRIKFLEYSPFGSLERVAIAIWRNRDSKVLLEERGNLTLAVRLQPITSCNSQIQRFQKNRRDRLSECGSCHITVDVQTANPTHQGCVGLLSRGPSCCTSLSDIEEGHLVLGESIRHVDALPGENAREQFLGVRIGPPGIKPSTAAGVRIRRKSTRVLRAVRIGEESDETPDLRLVTRRIPTVLFNDFWTPSNAARRIRFTGVKDRITAGGRCSVRH